jgi:hypothetical protein
MKPGVTEKSVTGSLPATVGRFKRTLRLSPALIGSRVLPCSDDAKRDGQGARLVLEGVAGVHDMLDCPREDWRCAGKAAMLVLWRRQIHPIPRGRPGRGICPSR